jgi:hypothetical protein
MSLVLYDVLFCIRGSSGIEKKGNCTGTEYYVGTTSKLG